MSKVGVFLSFTLLIVIMLMTNAEKELDWNSLPWEYKCTKLGHPCGFHMTPCCGEEHELQKVPIIRCRPLDPKSDDKFCQLMPNDYYRYVRNDE